MSQLTTKTKVVYVALLYDEDGCRVDEGYDCDLEEHAIENAKELVSEAVAETGTYHFAEIKTRILPVWEG